MAGYPGPTSARRRTRTQDDGHALPTLPGAFYHPAFIGPLVIWLIKKDDHPFIDDQGKESLNFQITVLIALRDRAADVCLFVGLLSCSPVVGYCGLVFAIIAAVKANNGIAYRYPFDIRLIK